MPSATLNNSDPGSTIGQARKSHPPASSKNQRPRRDKRERQHLFKAEITLRGSHFPTSHNVLLKREHRILGTVVSPRCRHRCPRLTKGNAGAFLTPLLQSNSKRKQLWTNPDFIRVAFTRLFQVASLVTGAEIKTHEGFQLGLDYH